MLEAGVPSAFRHPSERKLMGEVPAHFEAFYRAHLRFRSGARIRTIEVAKCYGQWAEQTGTPSMNMSAIKRAMFHIGHQCIRSNGMHFTDVQPAADERELADNFPATTISISDRGMGILSSINVMEAELSRLRAAVQHGAVR